jgi:hypothetical protein
MTSATGYLHGDRIVATTRITDVDGKTIAEPGDIGWVEHILLPGEMPIGGDKGFVITVKRPAVAVHFDHIPHANLSWVAQDNITAAQEGTT